MRAASSGVAFRIARGSQLSVRYSEEEETGETGTKVGAVGWSKLVEGAYSELEIFILLPPLGLLSCLGGEVQL